MNRLETTPSGPSRLIQLAPSDPTWPAQAQAELQQLSLQLGPLVVQAEHIGSTAVAGLWAKPVLDLLLEVQSVAALDALAVDWPALGYQARGEHGIEGRRYFVKGLPQHSHHLHVFASGHPALVAHRQLRDYLRATPSAAARYQQTKQQLLAQGPVLAAVYQQGKDAMLRQLINEAQQWAATSRR